MELAYGTVYTQPFSPDSVATMSASGASTLSVAYGVPVDSIPVLGNPQLDNLKTWSALKEYSGPAGRPILAVSTSELPTRDPNGLLRTVVRQLQETGHDIVVAPHPREDLSYWNGFSFTRVQDTVHLCSVAIGLVRL